MRSLFLASLLCVVFACGHAQAATADAREVARLNNCPPKKIEVYQQSLGAAGKTIYRVTCNLPKAADQEAAPMADAILVQCAGSLCSMMNSVKSQNK